MKLRVIGIAVIAVLAGACSNAPGVGPTALGSPEPVSAGGTFTKRTTTTNCNPPAEGAIVFSTTELGKVTVTNASSCTNDYLFVLWRVLPGNDPNDLEKQVNVGQFPLHLAPGQTGVATLGLQDLDCQVNTYQRDVFFGVNGINAKGVYDPKVTFSDVVNAKVYAPGVFWKSGQACTPDAPEPLVVIIPPTNPPVDVCSNLEGAQGSIPEGYELSDGLCVPIEIEPPPPNIPTDVCPNLPGNQETLPAGYEFVGGSCQVIPPPPPPPPVCSVTYWQMNQGNVSAAQNACLNRGGIWLGAAFNHTKVCEFTPNPPGNPGGDMTLFLTTACN